MEKVVQQGTIDMTEVEVAAYRRVEWKPEVDERHETKI